MLGGGVAVAALVATGCGLDNRGDPRLVALFDPRLGNLITGIPQRIVLGTAEREGTLRTQGPSSLDVQVFDGKGRELTSVAALRRTEGLDHPYYPVTFTPPEPSRYRVAATIEGSDSELTFLVGTRRDSVLLQPGDPMPATRTPTTADAAGVDPICTREPPCPLHEISLDTVLGTGPVALLIASPGNCAGPVCWPVLDLLVEAAPAFSAVTAIHAEVYRDAGRVADLADALPSPATSALGLNFEPSLALIDSEGVLRERLDFVLDRSELTEALERAATY